jgi:iron complex transport system ATP-binding protein
MALQSNRLVAGYSGREVIRGVDLTLDRGQLICLLGPNGSGKSTLVRALCGILHHSDGQVRLDGEDLHDLSPAARARQIGFLPQEVQPGFSFRVHEAVALGARCAGQASWFRPGPNPETDAAVRRALEAVDALDLIDRQLDHLSGGERRRVLLASVLAQSPRYLLLDEPTAMLDLEHQASLFERLAELARNGLGVLVVTHDLNLAARWADQILLLQNGKITASGTSKEVLVREKLEPVFGQRFDLLQTEAGNSVVVPK